MCMLAGTAWNVLKAANGNDSVMHLFNFIICAYYYHHICGVLVRAPVLNPEGMSENPTNGRLLLDEYIGLDFCIRTCQREVNNIKDSKKSG